MAKTRVTRSKTGCQSCRRRKVRCDEAKPICNACARLELTCSFQPGAGPGQSPETPRYRVRFAKPSGPRQGWSGGNSNSPLTGKGRNNIVAPTVNPCPTGDTPPWQRVDDGTIRDATSSHNGSPNQIQLQQEQCPNAPHGPQSIAVNETAQASIAGLPPFFDLNMNFDIFGGEWLAQPQVYPQADMVQLHDTTTVPLASRSRGLVPTTALSSPSVSPIAPTPESAPIIAETTDTTVIIGAEDHRLIRHYLEVMSQYAKVRGSRDENIYTQIFNSMALFYSPLYNAIMAWTALHLGQIHGVAQDQSLEPPPAADPVTLRRAEQRYSDAVTLLHNDSNVAHHLDLALVTLWFTLQFELLAARGVDSFCRHLEFAADLLDAHRRDCKTRSEVTSLGPIGARVLVWLGTYDARASWIGNAGRLLQNLEIFYACHDFLDVAFPDSTSRTASTLPTESTASPPPTSTTDLKPFLRLTVELDTIEGHIAHLHRRGTPAPATIWMAAQRDLLSIQQRLEAHLAIAPILSAMFGGGKLSSLPATSSPTRSLVSLRIDTTSFNHLLLLSACYSLIISYHRVHPKSTTAISALNNSVNSPAASRVAGDLITAESAAARIICISSWVMRVRPPSPQNIWSRILFTAGIETTDPVYQEWVVHRYVEAEAWGSNFGKTRQLLERVLECQGRTGDRVDYLDVMKETTGCFII